MNIYRYEILSYELPHLSDQSEVRQTNLASEQLWHDRNPKCEHEENVADSNLMARWQLISNPTNLLNVEAKWEDDSSKTEDYHGDEANPSCIWDHIPVPSTSDQQHYHREQQNARRNDENKRNEPFGG